MSVEELAPLSAFVLEGVAEIASAGTYDYYPAIVFIGIWGVSMSITSPADIRRPAMAAMHRIAILKNDFMVDTMFVYEFQAFFAAGSIFFTFDAVPTIYLAYGR